MLNNQDFAILATYRIARLKSLHPPLENCTIALLSDRVLHIVVASEAEAASIQNIGKKLQRNAWIVTGAVKISICFDAKRVEILTQFVNVGNNCFLNEVESGMTNATVMEKESLLANPIDQAVDAAIQKLQSVPPNHIYPVAFIAKNWGLGVTELQQELDKLEAVTMVDETADGRRLITVTALMEAIKHGLLLPLLQQKALALISFMNPAGSAQATASGSVASPTKTTRRQPRKITGKTSGSRPKAIKSKPADANGAAAPTGETPVANSAVKLPTRLSPGFEVNNKRPSQTLETLMTKLRIDGQPALVQAVLTDLISNPNSVYRKRIKEKRGDVSSHITAAKRMLKMGSTAKASS